MLCRRHNLVHWSNCLLLECGEKRKFDFGKIISTMRQILFPHLNTRILLLTSSNGVNVLRKYKATQSKPGDKWNAFLSLKKKKSLRGWILKNYKDITQLYGVSHSVGCPKVTGAWFSWNSNISRKICSHGLQWTISRKEISRGHAFLKGSL